MTSALDASYSEYREARVASHDSFKHHEFGLQKHNTDRENSEVQRPYCTWTRFRVGTPLFVSMQPLLPAFLFLPPVLSHPHILTSSHPHILLADSGRIHPSCTPTLSKRCSVAMASTRTPKSSYHRCLVLTCR
jgi:hypothetical protein